MPRLCIIATPGLQRILNASSTDLVRQVSYEIRTNAVANASLPRSCMEANLSQSQASGRAIYNYNKI